MERIRSIPTSRQQRGISLFIVIVLVMLSMLLALWGSRTSLFNEMIVGNDADYQRAFEAAQALIQDAEFDIQGEQANGSPCNASVAGANNRHMPDPPELQYRFPKREQRCWVLYLIRLSAAATKCFKGVCLKRTGEQDFWNDKTTLTAMMNENVGARYGQFTGAQAGNTSNPILAYNDPANNKDKGGWYWIEIMPYDSNAGNTGLITNGSNNLALNLTPSVAYRITAIAHGLKPSTQVVLQSTYVRQKMKN